MDEFKKKALRILTTIISFSWLLLVLAFVVFFGWWGANTERVCSEEYFEKRKEFVEACSIESNPDVCNRKAVILWCKETNPWDTK